MSEEVFDPGTQIAYIPLHAEGDISHPDCEFGFVTSSRILPDGPRVYWCRFWYKNRPGELRTIRNSERVYAWQLRKHESVKLETVEFHLRNIRFYQDGEQ